MGSGGASCNRTYGLVIRIDGTDLVADAGDVAVEGMDDTVVVELAIPSFPVSRKVVRSTRAG